MTVGWQLVDSFIFSFSQPWWQGDQEATIVQNGNPGASTLSQDQYFTHMGSGQCHEKESQVHF